MTSVMELQGEVARAITDQIRIELTPQQQAHLTRTRHTEPAALELYLQGMQRLNSGDPRAAAAQLFRSAVEEDPDYAAAHAAMATAWLDGRSRLDLLRRGFRSAKSRRAEGDRTRRFPPNPTSSWALRP